MSKFMIITFIVYMFITIFTMFGLKMSFEMGVIKSHPLTQQDKIQIKKIIKEVENEKNNKIKN
jgi:predicted phosphatase